MRRAQPVMFVGKSYFAIAISAAMALNVMTLVPVSARATPAFSGQTGQPCGACHVNKAGGGALTEVGEKFKANGNKMK